MARMVDVADGVGRSNRHSAYRIDDFLLSRNRKCV
jgi:hypothetical protein